MGLMPINKRPDEVKEELDSIFENVSTISFILKTQLQNYNNTYVFHPTKG